MTSSVMSIWACAMRSAGASREERLERPEREGVEDDVDPGPAPLGVEDPHHLGDRLGPLLVVGGVHVEENGLRPGGRRSPP